jgi:Calcium binding
MTSKRKTSNIPIASARQLDKLIEEATVDAYDEEQQATGFFTMIEENLALPFRTRVLGIEVSGCGRDG